jgi:hypothetical protein
MKEQTAGHESTTTTAGPGRDRQRRGPVGVLSLQRRAGNAAVAKLLAGGPASEAIAVQRLLTTDAAASFAKAKQVNATEYAPAEADVDGHVPEVNQKAIVKGTRSKGVAKGPEGVGFAELVQAWTLRQHGNVLKKKNPADAPRYLKRGVEYAEMYAPLVKTGPNAPESQSFLRGTDLKGAMVAGAATQQIKPTKLPRVDVRATMVGAGVRGHLLVVYTNSEGEQWVLRGGPSGNPGHVEVNVGRYKPGHIDYDPAAPTAVVAQGDAARGSFERMIAVAEEINAAKIPYGVPDTLKAALAGIGSNLPGKPMMKGGESCTSAAYTMIKKAGLSPKKPSGIHPGWGHIIGTESGKTLAPQALDAPADKRLRLPVDAKLYADRKMGEVVAELPKGTIVEVLAQTDTGALSGDKAGRIKLHVKAGDKTGWIKRSDDHVVLAEEGGGERAVVDGPSKTMFAVFAGGKQVGEVKGGATVYVLQDLDMTDTGRAGNAVLIRFKHGGKWKEGDFDAGHLRYSRKDAIEVWQATTNHAPAGVGALIGHTNPDEIKLLAVVALEKGYLLLRHPNPPHPHLWVKRKDWEVITGKKVAKGLKPYVDKPVVTPRKAVLAGKANSIVSTFMTDQEAFSDLYPLAGTEVWVLDGADTFDFRPEQAAAKVMIRYNEGGERLCRVLGKDLVRVGGAVKPKDPPKAMGPVTLTNGTVVSTDQLDQLKADKIGLVDFLTAEQIQAIVDNDPGGVKDAKDLMAVLGVNEMWFGMRLLRAYKTMGERAKAVGDPPKAEDAP